MRTNSSSGSFHCRLFLGQEIQAKPEFRIDFLCYGQNLCTDSRLNTLLKMSGPPPPALGDPLKRSKCPQLDTYPYTNPNIYTSISFATRHTTICVQPTILAGTIHHRSVPTTPRQRQHHPYQADHVSIPKNVLRFP